MCRVLIFGGTSEGRVLHEFTNKRGIPALTCVATDYGAELLDGISGVHTGRLNRAEMLELMKSEGAVLVVDATHPYATEASENIRDACRDCRIEYLRVLRESGSDKLECFDTLDSIIERLKHESGIIFVTTGAKEAAAFTVLPDFKERVFLRILPSVEGLAECIKLGYPAKRLICMQGPFSRELNTAMFKSTGAEILVTKESGAAGGFTEKLEAAAELGLKICVLGRPADASGVSLASAMERISAL